MALICYCDGFVLVGSVAGQRYWSSMLNLDNTSITCGVWSPDDHKVRVIRLVKVNKEDLNSSLSLFNIKKAFDNGQVYDFAACGMNNKV